MKSHVNFLRQVLSAVVLFCLLPLPPVGAQTIKPVIRFANLLGGSGAETISAVATDPDGNVYLTGTTSSSDFPTTTTISMGSDTTLFVAKATSSGSTLAYSALIGHAQPTALTVGPDGAVYVAGVGAAEQFPITTGAAVTSGHCFLLKLDPAGSRLAYSTRLGCTDNASIPPAGLAVDAAGNAYVAGDGGGIVTTPGAYSPSGFGAFVIKVNAAGSALVYGTYLHAATPRAIASDLQGNVYLTGSAVAQSFPVTQDTLPRERAADGATTSDDVFLLKLSPDGAQVVFSALFGGYGADSGSAIALGQDASIFISGTSQKTTGFGSRDPFPTTPGALDGLPGMPRGFLAKLTADGSGLLFSTFLPDADDGACLAVNDGGLDVMTTQLMKDQSPQLSASRLQRVSFDGASLLGSSIAAFAGSPYCGHSGERFALANRDGALTSPDLSSIGPGGRGDVWFAVVDADVPGAPRLEVNAGALELLSWSGLDMPDSNWPGSIHAQTGDKALPIVVRGSSCVAVEPEQGSTPLDVKLRPVLGSYADQLFLFAPGAQDGLVLLPVRERHYPVSFTFDPTAYPSSVGPGVVQLAVDAPDAPPVSGTLRVSSPAVSDLFGTPTQAHVRFDLRPFGSLPSWLTMEGVPGTTPAEVRFTASGAGLSQGLYSTFFQVGHPDGFSWQSTVPATIVSFRVGPAPAPVPTLIPSQQFPYFRLTEDSPIGTTVIHLESSTGDPVTFTADPLPDWIRITPLSGTTPTDLTLTVAPPRDISTYWRQTIQFRSSNRLAGSIEVNADVLLNTFIGTLTVTPMSPKDSTSVDPNDGVAPGALFYASLPRMMRGSVPENSQQSGAWALATSLAGYSFVLEGQAVPARSYAGGRFVLQMPAGVAPGTHRLEVLDDSSQVVASSNVTVVAVRPQMLDDAVDYGQYARKEDGSAVTPDNPAHPGDRILVRVTGQGAVVPAVPDGLAAAVEDPSRPNLPVTAYVGLKRLTVVSAMMSTSEAGVLDVWVEVPDLYDGDHYVAVHVGPLSAGVIPLKVVTPPAEEGPLG